MRDKSTKDVSAPDLTQAEKKISIKADGYDFVEPIAGEVLTPAGRTSEQASTANATLSKLDSEKHEQKAATPARVRKPRSDKGQPRKVEPVRVRSNGLFMVTSHVTLCAGQAELEDYLESLSESGRETARVFKVREIKYERKEQKTQYKFRGI